MKPIKVLIKLVDKDKIFTLKGKYDPETRIATAKRKLFDKTPLKFQVDPVHIYYEGRRRVCYVDNATRSSKSIHSNDPIDQKTATSLNLLIDQAFWKGIMEKRKISAMTAFALIMAGIGVYTLLVTILRAAGINV
ncbi:MAG: hypothetical protein H5T34_04285 [Candidatus Methanomethyliales bacterium]|nr:hypothetical protein [Candidatus Methanomethylicales archaeon]